MHNPERVQKLKEILTELVDQIEKVRFDARQAKPCKLPRK